MYRKPRLPRRKVLGYNAPMEHIKRDRLIYWRKRAGLSQTEAGASFNAHRSTIAKLERGEISLNDDWLRRLSTLYGCEPWELVEGAPILDETERLLIKLAEGLDQDARQALLQVASQMARKPSQ